MFHSKTKEIQKTSEELKQKTSEVVSLYNKFAEELLGELPFLDKNYFKASPYLNKEIFSELVLRNGQLTINQLLNIFKRYIGRSSVRSVCGFNKQKFLRESRDLKKSGVHLEIYFNFEKDIEIQHDFGIRFNVSTGYIEKAMLEKFKEIEINAVNLLGYERGQWILQEIFVEGDDKDHFLLREQALEKFLKAEYQEFIARWEDLIVEKQEEVRAVYSQSLKDIAIKLKQKEYDWLKLN
ncbi:hypothetical protein [Priestia megaterium]|uniref:Uncharacterized protein n=1 Tax=Priestia megaterium TaxID=1404 RepID=A0A6M6DYQ7_PRIMG|nr:hypothetical protein [Priestia megaterium]QJX80063.1 hypothetical protein FDZ14_28620 [Priestia megaterium]